MKCIILMKQPLLYVPLYTSYYYFVYGQPADCCHLVLNCSSGMILKKTQFWLQQSDLLLQQDISDKDRSRTSIDSVNRVFLVFDVESVLLSISRRCFDLEGARKVDDLNDTIMDKFFLVCKLCLSFH